MYNVDTLDLSVLIPLSVALWHGGPSPTPVKESRSFPIKLNSPERSPLSKHCGQTLVCTFDAK